jgi:alkylhydroperoxidase/carboxymuconolactone decarboxylase family protein YurZ
MADPTPTDDAATDLTPSLRRTFPALREAQSAYLGAIDSLQSPDRLTQELIRLASSVILRHPEGVARHAMLAAEFGATWEDVVGTLVLTQPGWGLVPALEAMTHARTGFEEGRAAAAADDDDEI